MASTGPQGRHTAWVCLKRLFPDEGSAFKGAEPRSSLHESNLHPLALGAPIQGTHRLRSCRAIHFRAPRPSRKSLRCPRFPTSVRCSAFDKPGIRSLGGAFAIMQFTNPLDCRRSTDGDDGSAPTRPAEAARYGCSTRVWGAHCINETPSDSSGWCVSARSRARSGRVRNFGA